jgi:hypothetical protein
LAELEMPYEAQLQAMPRTLSYPLACLTAYVLALRLAQEQVLPPALEVARSAMQQR